MTRYFSFAMCMVFTLLSSAAFADSSRQPNSSAGYSIFHETMVDMPWQEVEKLANPDTLVLFPTGVIEEHGPHKPLGTDVYLSYIQSKMLKQELEKRGVTTLIAPPFYWGINVATGAWPGSFTSRASTVKAVLWDALASLKRWGFQNVVFINHHGDPVHNKVIVEAIAEARHDTGIRAYYMTNEEYAKRLHFFGRDDVLIRKTPAPAKEGSGPNTLAAYTQKYVDPHAGRVETSRLAAYFPDLVNTKMTRELTATKITPEKFETWLEGWSVARKMTPPGYVGDPAHFNPEQGKAENEATVASMADVIDAFLKGSYKPGELAK